MNAEAWSGTGRLVELTPEECWEVLGTQRVGRVAWCQAGFPQVTPVNYRTDDGAVWLRTAAYTRLGLEARGRRVVLEVDEVDPFTRSGVSVTVEGRATAVQDGGSEGSRVETWVEGHRDLVLRIDALSISGRRLMPS